MRLLALKDGIAATGTLARIDALGAADSLSADVQDYRRGAVDHITGLQLRQQIRDYQAGLGVTNFVDPGSLTERETDMLKDGFRAINDFRARLRADLTGEAFETLARTRDRRRASPRRPTASRWACSPASAPARWWAMAPG